MPTRVNRFWNNPQYAQVASSLAGMFAPPSAGDELAYAKAASETAQATRLADLWNEAGNFDQRGVAAGLYTPAQSYYGVDTAAATERRGQDVMSGDRRYNVDSRDATAQLVAEMEDATARRGQDVAATTSRANTATTARYGLASDLATTRVGPGERAMGTTILDDEIAQAAGLVPGMGIEGREAAPDPLSSDEVVALAMQGRAAEDPLYERELAFSQFPNPVKVEKPDGSARYSTPGMAGYLGLPAYSDQGGRAGSEIYNYRAPDGREGTATFDPNTGSLVDSATGQALPEGVTTYKLEGGDKAAVTGATTANQTAANDAVAQANYGLTRVAEFRNLLEANQGILGVPGMIRGVAQDVGQAASDMVGAFGAEGNLASVEEVRRLAASVSQSQGYDPAFAQAAALALEMAYLDAKMQDPSGEVNVRELERNLAVYDGGIAGNARVLATLDNLESRLQSVRDIYADQLRNPAGAAPTPGSGPSYPASGTAAATPQPGTVEDGYEFLGGDPADPNSWRQVQ